MIRHVAAVVVVMLLSPSWVSAQGTELTVNVASASVHKSPSAGSPVIGHASRGARLEVTREVGDWVKVNWPAANDGVGYVRLSLGSMGKATPGAAANSATLAQTNAQPAPRLVTTTTVESQQTGNRLPVRTTTPSPDPSHVFGMGATFGGPAFGFGASARAWSRGRLGVQFQVSRHEASNPIDLSTMSTTQFGPSALYAFNDHVADYTWLRPYAGAGLNIQRSTMTDALTGIALSESTFGSHVFGGGELSFASVPQFAVSVELSYHWFDSPFPGFDLGGTGLGVAGHWYFR